jgi:sialidase-1
MKDGRLLLVYQEFKKGSGDSDFFPGRLVARTSKDGGLTWGDYHIVVENEPGDINVMSPSLTRRTDGAIVLTFLRNHSFARARATYPPISGFAWISRDEGATFSPLSAIYRDREYSLCNNTLRRLASGRLIQTINRDVGKKGSGDHWQAGCAFSDDGGKTWAFSDTWVDAPKRGAMEPHADEIRDNHLLMVMRTQAGSVWVSVSKDGGKTWSKGEPLGIESPESCPELLNVPGTGDLVLIWNASKYDPKWASHFGKRTPLSAAVSKDGGRTWSKPRHFETDPGWAFSNPGAYITSKGKVLVNYWACKYRPNGYMSNFPIDLKAAIVDVQWLYDGE